MKRKPSRFVIGFCTFCAVCLIASAVFLLYTYRVVREYDAAQPARTAEGVLADFRGALRGGALPASLTFPEFSHNRFEQTDTARFAENYRVSLDPDRLSYRLKTGAGGDMTRVYVLYSDETPIATLTLNGSNSRSRLFFFNMADWEVASLTPIFTAPLYTYRVFLPAGVHAFINGVEVTDAEKSGDGEIPEYTVRDLTAEPTIALFDESGEALDYEISANVVTPILYRYAFTLPEALTVTCGGTPLAGEACENGRRSYTVASMTDPQIVIEDGYGNRFSYHGEDSLPYYRYTLTLPANYRAETGCRVLRAEDAAREAHPDAALIAPYAPDACLPDLLTWQIDLLSEAAVVTLTDPLGRTTDHTLTDHTLYVGMPAGTDALPEELALQVDPMEIALLWSRFMTDDLEGGTRGFETIAPYLIRGSSYYRSARAWATGIDISLVSVHTITSFTGKRISNFVSYSDSCFSCDLYFEKNMNLYDSHGQGLYAGSRTDVFYNTVYFVCCDDTPDNGIDDPHWAIALMREILN